MITGEDEQHRPWADICPDLLNSIYTRLPSHVDGTHLGGVCKNWHQIHSHIAISNPLPMEISQARFYSSDIVQVREGNRLFAQPCRETQIPKWLIGAGGAKILGRAGAWLLLNKYGGSLCCYNPLLRRPANYVALPDGSWHFSDLRRAPVAVKVAFSALPTARDSVILMVYGDRYLSVLRCRCDGMWKTYDLSLLGGKKNGQTCLGVGYRKGKFFGLLETGDVLIFSVHRKEPRMLLTATKPLLLERWDSLRVVAPKEAVVTHWERDHDQKDSFRLVAVEENATYENNDDDDDDGCEMVEDEKNNRGVIIVKDRLSLERNSDGFYVLVLCCMFFMALNCVFLGIAWLHKLKSK